MLQIWRPNKQAPYETLIEEFPLKLDNIAAYMGLNLSDNS
jgi:hypothetical protein